MLIDIAKIPFKDGIPRISHIDGYKKRVLFVGEANFLNTGFSTYYRNVIGLLYKTGKYKIAEFGSYAPQQDSRWLHSGTYWKYYGNEPDIVGYDPQKKTFVRDQQQSQIYSSDNINQFGKWKFTSVLLDFKPDIVVAIRDWWMDEYELKNPFRKNFIHIWMPTVDGDPQKEEWIEDYRKVDYLLSYSLYGKRLLESQSGKALKVIEIAQPGYEKDIFKPVGDREKHRKKWNMKNDLFIVGTTMRNQRRKLFPLLIKAFKNFIDTYPEESRKAILLLHTSYPDVGWDIPRFVKRYGLQKKIIFTYFCHKCKFAFVNYWTGEKVKCWRCGEVEARCPNTSMGVSREQLADIYNLMDIYVQYAICEGYGMPIVEAKACGIPVMATNNTAMTEQVGDGQGGLPIDYTSYIEPDTWCTRAIPNEIDFIDKLASFIRLSDNSKKKMSEEAINSIKDFTWENCAKKWETILDTVPIKDRLHTWEAPVSFKTIPYAALQEVPEIAQLPNLDFINRLYADILDRVPDPDGVKNWLTSLDKGMSRQQVLNYFIKVAMEHNMLESARTGQQYRQDTGFQVVSL
jgi:glycosyltransferase involved in cell wall biosynthesis